jgi:arabinofuranosyltransferase
LNEQIDRRRWLTGLWLLASLLYLTRPDDVLLAVPVLLVACLEVRRVRDIARAAAVGLLPAAAWTVFAGIYYGFPFPNTAYAKLGMGIDARELWTQGFLYFIDSVDRDPLTLVVVAFGVGLAFVARTRPMRALGAGIVLYLVYVVSIGGDFMAGRFLSSPFYVAVLVIGRSAIAAREMWIAAPIALGALAFSSPQVPIGTDSRFESPNIKLNGAVDERAIYFRTQSLVRAGRTTFVEPEYPVNDHVARPLHIMELCGLTGDAGVNWGPQAHVLDWCALVDPLLARLPAAWNSKWRIGHFRRMYPKGYRESIETGTNRLEDPQLREFFDKMRLIIRSPNLFSPDRWRAIIGMNLGRYNYLINRPYYRYNGETVRVEDLSWVKPEESALDAPSDRQFELSLAVLCDDRRGRRYMDIAVPSDEAYKLEFIHKNTLVSVFEFGPVPEYRRKPGLTRYTIDIPAKAASVGFDTIFISVVKGGAVHTVGHLLLDGNPTTDPELLRQVARRDGFGVK